MKLVAFIFLLIALTSCGTSDSSGQELPSCAPSACVDEIRAIEEDLALLSGVTSVDDVQWIRGKALSWPEVEGSIVIDSMDPADCYELADDLAQTAWESSVAPLEGYSFDCFATGATRAESVWEHWDRKAMNALNDKYGERGPQ